MYSVRSKLRGYLGALVNPGSSIRAPPFEGLPASKIVPCTLFERQVIDLRE